MTRVRAWLGMLSIVLLILGTLGCGATTELTTDLDRTLLDSESLDGGDSRAKDERLAGENSQVHGHEESLSPQDEGQLRESRDEQDQDQDQSNQLALEQSEETQLSETKDHRQDINELNQRTKETTKPLLDKPKEDQLHQRQKETDNTASSNEEKIEQQGVQEQQAQGQQKRQEQEQGGQEQQVQQEQQEKQGQQKQGTDSNLQDQAAQQTITFTIIGPEDTGTILEDTEVEFKEGETVLDTLKRVTREHKIQMEYRGRKGTAYIEGINNIYEFDYGAESGWLYSVNGVFPNRGAGVWPVEANDHIRWLYTVDLGKDWDAYIPDVEDAD